MNLVKKWGRNKFKIINNKFKICFMLTTRNKIFIIISVVVGVILSLLLFYFFISDPKVKDKEEAVDSNLIINNLTGAVNNNGGDVVQQQNIDITPLPDSIYVKQLSRDFVERFGSYSNQNNNAHIEGVMDLVTDKVARWLKTQTINKGEDYYGVTTKVIASSVKNLSSEEAVVEVGVQKIITEQGEDRTEYDTGNVNLLNVDGEWMIDGLFWEKK
jgi:hypothetical protein